MPFDGAILQAFADTLVPGRKAVRTDLGDEIHPRAIAGVDPEPGAVEADALRLFRSPLLGFPALAPVFLADLTARALARRAASFLDLPYERRVRTVIDGLDFDNPTRLRLGGRAPRSRSSRSARPARSATPPAARRTPGCA